MHLLTMFDLPTKTKPERRIYRRFRKRLLELGFTKMQFSVYLKFADGKTQCEALQRCVRKALPKKGNIRMLILTDKQYETMLVFDNNKETKNAIPTPDFIVF
ncbi:MAG: CRISPR-associated endonuclease Cas2 [Planctomycetaceae bacterium]|jgi:CRISPR-associated protein Cas2|nr:CRISPR-associated endonuclease Cas2 [Planctomycetaceae bacterium]